MSTIHTLAWLQLLICVPLKGWMLYRDPKRWVWHFCSGAAILLSALVMIR